MWTYHLNEQCYVKWVRVFDVLLYFILNVYFVHILICIQTNSVAVILRCVWYVGVVIFSPIGLDD